jgi:hypothetical protein
MKMFYKKSNDPTIAKKSNLNDPMMHPSTNISKSNMIKLEATKRSLATPIARLIAIAIDNELDSNQPFHYAIPDISEVPIIEGEYFSESVKVHTYLMNFFKQGAGYDTLLLLRADFNIPDKRVVMLACRELILNGQCEEIIDRNPWNPPNYKKIKISLESRRYGERQKKYKELEKLKDKGPLGEA